MKHLFCLGAASLMLCACSEMSNPQVSSAEENENSHSVKVVSSAIISDPEQDPYTVENMSKALRKTALAKSVTAQDSAEVESLTLDANFLYVRFLCEGKEGVKALKERDSSIVLFKHPMDYKDIQGRIVYKDPSLPEGVIPMFATVPVDYDFGTTEYEVIKELFLVEPLDGEGEEDSRALLKKAKGLTKTASNKLAELGVSLNEVEWNSLEMTGNLEERLGSDKDEIGNKAKLGWSLGGGGKKYGGQLLFMDDLSWGRPLIGVRVTGGYSYYWREAHTDNEGKFSIPEKWTLSINYEANFDSDDFVMEDGESIVHLDLEIVRKGKKSDWNENFVGEEAQWAMIWTAAYQYWYGDNYGLQRPRKGNAFDIEVFTSLDKYVAAITDNKSVWRGCGTYKYLNGDIYRAVPVIGYDSKIYHYNRILVLRGKEQADIMRTYSSMIMAIARMVADYYQKIPCCKDVPDKEERTFGKGMEWFFTKKRYAMLDNYYPHYDKEAPGLFQDLYDTDTRMGNNDGTSGDLVSGLDIKSMEQAFLLQSIRFFPNHLRENYSHKMNSYGGTGRNIEKIFDYWGLEYNQY